MVHASVVAHKLAGSSYGGASIMRSFYPNKNKITRIASACWLAAQTVNVRSEMSRSQCAYEVLSLRPWVVMDPELLTRDQEAPSGLCNLRARHAGSSPTGREKQRCERGQRKRRGKDRWSTCLPVADLEEQWKEVRTRAHTYARSHAQIKSGAPYFRTAACRPHGAPYL